MTSEVKIEVSTVVLVRKTNPKKVSFFESKCRKLHFLKFSKKSYFGAVFLTKTTVLTSILTSEVTYMVPQPQFELGKVPETQSGTWGNLVPHMCKSHQTTSVKNFEFFGEMVTMNVYCTYGVLRYVLYVVLI